MKRVIGFMLPVLILAGAVMVIAQEPGGDKRKDKEGEPKLQKLGGEDGGLTKLKLPDEPKKGGR